VVFGLKKANMATLANICKKQRHQVLMLLYAPKYGLLRHKQA